MKPSEITSHTSAAHRADPAALPRQRRVRRDRRRRARDRPNCSGSSTTRSSTPATSASARIVMTAAASTYARDAGARRQEPVPDRRERGPRRRRVDASRGASSSMLGRPASRPTTCWCTAPSPRSSPTCSRGRSGRSTATTRAGARDYAASRASATRQGARRCSGPEHPHGWPGRRGHALRGIRRSCFDPPPVRR